jgi:hypothetical protein
MPLRFSLSFLYRRRRLKSLGLASLASKVKQRFGLTLVGYGGHNRLWTQPANFTADSVGHVEIAGDSRLNTGQTQ